MEPAHGDTPAQLGRHQLVARLAAHSGAAQRRLDAAVRVFGLQGVR
jgi:hypothetical protein